MLDQFKKDIMENDFLCVRLSSDREHKSLIKHFTSRKSLLLPVHLQRYAWREDVNNYRSFYLVKEKKRIVCYFSLQAGLLVKCRKKILGGIVAKEVAGQKDYYIDKDKIDVSAVIPAIELAHFCVNDTYRKNKRNNRITYGIYDYTIGVYVFYKFIAPIIIELSSKIGMQYVYLFCADDWTNSLTKYYTEHLHFQQMDDMACIRPDYDEGLECLTLKIADLITDRARFEDLGRTNLVIDYMKTHGTISNYQARREFGISDPEYLFICITKKGLALVDAKNSKGSIVRIKNPCA